MTAKRVGWYDKANGLNKQFTFLPSYIHGDMAHKFLPNNRKLLDYEGKSICSVYKGWPLTLFVMRHHHARTNGFLIHEKLFVTGILFW